MPYYFLKLNPPRPSFSSDMNAEERAVMQSHVAYWQGLMQRGLVTVYGPVLDPAGAYGIGIVHVEDEDELVELIGKDPANGLNRYDCFPMRAIVPQ